MKKILIVMFALLICSSIRLQAYTETGHSMYYSIEFVDEGDLLVNMSKYERNMANKKVDKSQFWGWKTEFYNTSVPIEYVGEYVFARTNSTNQPFTFSYKTSETVKTTLSVSADSSISQKVSGGDKVITASLSKELSSSISLDKTVTRTEEMDFDITILPNTKVSLRTIGTGKLSNGVSAYYVFWIRIKKGEWEVVDPKDTFYELYEEAI